MILAAIDPVLGGTACADGITCDGFKLVLVLIGISIVSDKRSAYQLFYNGRNDVFRTYLGALLELDQLFETD